MKRFLSIFAIMAMIVSMFSGVAFAVTHTEVYAELDNETLIYQDGFHMVTLSGKVFNESSDALEKVDTTYEVEEWTGTTWSAITIGGDTEFDIEDGEFSIQIPTYDYGVNNYRVVPADTTDYTFNNVPTFVIAYEMELESPADLTYTYPVSGQQIIQGVYVNGDGPEAATNVVLAYQDDFEADPNDTIATANFSDGDSFGFLFDGDDLYKVGDIGIYVEGVLTLEGEVEAGELAVTADPLTLNHSLDLGGQEVTFDFDLDADHTSGSALATDYNLQYSVTDSDGDAYPESAPLTDEQFTVTDVDEVVEAFDVDEWDAGTYTITAQLYTPTTVVEEATLELVVEDPEEYNLTEFSPTEIDVGGVTFDFNDITVMKYEEGTTSEAITTLSVTYHGAGIDETTEDSDAYDTDLDDNTFELEPTETGIIYMDVNVYDDTVANDGSLVATFEKEIEVTGWNVEVSPTEVVVDTENDIVVVVTNEDGVPVNNAYVDIDGNIVDSRNTNIQDGQYLFEDIEFTAVDKYDVELYSFDADDNMTSEITLTDEINVIGDEVYTVESDTAVLLNGMEETIYVSVLDSEGDVIYPTFYQMDYDEDGEEINTVNNLDQHSRKDMDEDGVKEAVELKVTPHEDAVETVVRATTDSDKKMGEVSMEVLKPELVHTGAEVLTENFDTDLEFTVVDPRDDSVIEETITIDTTAGNYTYIDTFTEEEALDSDSDEVWTATYNVEVGADNWDEAEEEEDTVAAKVMMGDVELGTLEVVKPTLTSDPEKVIIGSANNLVLTYTDGEGNPLEGYAVMLEEEEIGETDENGQVMYATSTVNTLSLVFEAETDVADNYTELTVKSGADITGPEITAEVDGNTAIITIADDTRVQKVAINGEEVDMFFAMPEVTEIVNLEPGVNTFNVQAVDINNNYSQATLELEIEEEAIEGIQFTLDEESEYGTPTLLGSTTMIPVRFAENLGATVSWDAPTATVTYEVNGTVIELTIGSTTAVVNGENVQLAQAPYVNELGRTMVPVRMVGEELGFTVHFTSMDAPITIK